MEYLFNDHLHNYAVWTAARAVQRGFSAKTKTIKDAIERANLKLLIANNEEFTAESFDLYHRKTAKIIIDSLSKSDKKLENTASYGRAAKIIAIYIKTAIIIRDSGRSNLARIAHPPIDNILLKNLHKQFNYLQLNNIKWTTLNEYQYFTIIGKQRRLNFDSFWKIEQYWTPIGLD